MIILELIITYYFIIFCISSILCSLGKWRAGRGEGGHLSVPQRNCQIIAEADQADLIEAVIMWLAAAVFSEHVLRLRNDFCIWW